MRQSLAFSARGYQIAPVATGDARLPGLLTACHGYFTLHYGDDARNGTIDALVALPTHKSSHDRMLLGVTAPSGELVGLIVLVQNWNRARQWCLRSMIIDPAHRGQGLGSAIYSALADQAKRTGAASILIGVLAANSAAHRFWLACGFTEVGREVRTDLTSDLIHLEHRFCQIQLKTVLPPGRVLGRQIALTSASLAADHRSQAPLRWLTAP